MSISRSHLYKLFGLIAVILPLWPLRPLHLVFNPDWFQWIFCIGNFGKLFVGGHGIPYFLSGKNLVLYPFPVFYGTIMTSILGMLSGYVGPYFALRLPIVLAFVFQYILCWILVEKITLSKAWAFGVSSLVVWTVYPLTNVYNRAALFESIAAGFLFAAFFSWVLFLLSGQKRQQLSYLVTVAFSLCVLGGAHPITTLYGYTFFAICSLITWSIIGSPDKKILWRGIKGLIAVGFVVACAMGSWVFSIKTFLGKLNVTESQLPLIYKEDFIDTFSTRFSLAPTDFRSVLAGVGIPTPYLDAQINMPLLVLLVLSLVMIVWDRVKSGNSNWKGFVQEGVMVWLFAGLFAITTWMSLSQTPFKFLPRFTWMIQMVYRMISYQDLMITMAMISLMIWQKKFFINFKTSLWRVALLVGVVSMSFTNLANKYTHIKGVAGNALNDPGVGLDLIRAEGSTRHNYVTIEIPKYSGDGSDILQRVEFNLDGGGNPQPATVVAEKTGFLRSYVTPFTWTHVYVDDKEVPHTSLAQQDSYVLIPVSQGTHTISAKMIPDSTWLLLRNLSITTMFVLMFSMLLIYIWNIKESLKA